MFLDHKEIIKLGNKKNQSVSTAYGKLKSSKANELSQELVNKYFGDFLYYANEMGADIKDNINNEESFREFAIWIIGNLEGSLNTIRIYRGIDI